MDQRKAANFLETSLYSMKESILPVLERYKNGMVPVTETKELKKPAAKLDKSIKIGSFTDSKAVAKNNEIIEVINNKNKNDKKDNISDVKEELLGSKSQETTSPKPSQSPRNVNLNKTTNNITTLDVNASTSNKKDITLTKK
jgi:hypothetical protein